MRFLLANTQEIAIGNSFVAVHKLFWGNELWIKVTFGDKIQGPSRGTLVAL